jgi:RNA polymerase sigma factor (sigma-70 family)
MSGKGRTLEDREFERVFWVLQPQLLRYACAQLDRATAEDVVSSTLMTLHRKSLASPRDEGEERAVRALAYKILVGHITNEYRSRRRRHALTVRLFGPDKGIGHVPSPESMVVGQSTLDAWLDRLSADDRRVVLLFNAGFDVREMAEILGCSESAAAKRRTRARERLRSMIDVERELT